MSKGLIKEARRMQQLAGIINENFVGLTPINSPFMENEEAEMYYIHDEEGMEEPIGPFTKEVANQKLAKYGSGWKLIDAESAKEIWSHLNEDEDEDMEDSDEEEYDFNAPGKKDEFDTDDDVEPTAKDVTKGDSAIRSLIDKQTRLNQLIKIEDNLLGKYKAGELTIDQFKTQIGDIPQQIKTLRADLESELSIDDEDED